MNKKIIITIICILAIIIGIACYFIFMGKNNKTNINTENNKNITDNNKTNNSKIGIMYFSATGNTEKIAKYIKEETNGDLIEIIPKEKYTSEDLAYNNDCRANREQQDENARPEIENSIDIIKYDTIFLGYPIWWGDVPKIILTFIDNNNLDGKVVIPFCTSGSTGILQSENTLKTYNKNMNLQSGRRFSSSANKEEISSWIKDLEI